MPEFFKSDFNQQLDNLWKLVGNTPFIAVKYSYQGGPEREILVKCEQYNMTGSVKDRMALYILQKAKEQNLIKQGDTIVEATSGNTGIAFAAIGKALGHRVKIIMPDWMNQGRHAILKSYGADLELVSQEQGGFLGSVRIAEAMSHFDNVFLPRHFENRYNVEAHEKTTGREIAQSLILEHMEPEAFVAGVGTGATVMGVGKYLRTIYPNVKIHPMEPTESPTLSSGYKFGNHRIQGISDEFVPLIVQLNTLENIVKIYDGDAILMAQKLSKDAGLGVGISSGANFLAAVSLQQASESKKAFITLFPDDNKRYVSMDLFKEESVQNHYLSSAIKLNGYRVLNKV